MGRVHIVKNRVTGQVSEVPFTLEEETVADNALAEQNHPRNYPLSLRQLRLGLLNNGYPITFIQDVIDQIPNATDRAIAQIWYEETMTAEWDHPMVQSLIAAAGIDEAAAILMWMAAKDIPA